MAMAAGVSSIPVGYSYYLDYERSKNVNYAFR